MHVYQQIYRDRRTGRVRKTRTWHYRFRLGGQRFQGSTGMQDRASALAIARDVFEDAQRELAGLPVESRRLDRRPVKALVGELMSELERRGCGARHIADTADAILRVAELARAEVIGDLTTQRIAGALHQLSHLSGRTQNRHRACVHALFEWLLDQERVDRNPVRRIERADETPRRHRALSVDELALLLGADVGPGAGSKHRADWRRRRAFYLIASYSGLRDSEIRALRVRDIVVQEDLLYLDGGEAKDGEHVTQPLERWVLEDLHAWFTDAGLGADDHPWPHRICSKTFLADLRRAKVARDTPAGRIDVHGLRRTYNTLLAQAGVELSQRQALMRHSDPRLTANVYTKLELRDARAAVAKLPRPEQKAGKGNGRRRKAR